MDIKMDFSRLVASTDTALDKLQYRRKQCSDTFHDRIYTLELGIIMRWLRVVRTFFLCSMTLADNVELRIESNNDNAATSQRSQRKRMKQKKRRMKKGLVSLLVRVKDVVLRISDDHIPHEPFGFQCDILSLEDEMDKWYTRLSDYLRQYSTSPVVNQIKVITDSVLDNLEVYLSSKIDYDYRFMDQVQQIESVLRNIRFCRNFIRFCTLLCAENQEFQYLVTQIEILAIRAAHITLHLFSNVKRPIPLPNGLTNSLVDYFFLCESYTRALASLKHSHNSTLDLNESPFFTIMEDFVVSLLSTLWKMLQSDIVSVVSLKDQLHTVYRGLRFLRIILKNQPEKFDNGMIWDSTVAATCDAGVIIFSLDQKDFEINHAIKEFSKNIQVIRLEFTGGYDLKTNYPQTNVLGFLDFLLEDYMEEVKGSKVDSDTLSIVPKIQEYLVFLKSFMGNLLESRNRQENLHRDDWNLAVVVGYKIEYLMDQLVLGDILDSFSMSLQSITEDIMVLKADSLIIFNIESQDIIKVQKITEVPSMISSAVADEVVGFGSEKVAIIDRLMRNSSKLEVVAIVGMPGSGKTTLATKVFQDSSVTYHYHKRAWCSISQLFDRKKVLLELLNQTKACEIKPTWDENDLSQELWRSLKGYKYLIFIDDIWDTKALEHLKESFPDDSNHSRILLTSRNGDVVSGYIPHDKPLLLPQLSMDESLELLQRKLFPFQKDWPSESIHELGKEIAVYCKGLPLTLVIIAGLLRTEEQEGWKDVLKTLRSSTVSDLTVRTIELSYTHLPDHLKPLFLWFSVYPEDYEISVKDIIWLWICEGLIPKFESKSPEEVARGYINILIARGLVMVARRRSGGCVKTCRIHDLLRDFCLRKNNEEFFFHISKVDANEDQDQLFPDEFETPSFYEPELRRLCIYPNSELLKRGVFCPCLRSLIFFGETKFHQKIEVIFRMFKLLRVLDISEIYLFRFTREIGVQLRYLAFRVDGPVSPAIGNLLNLEILVLNLSSGSTVVKLPDTLWNLQKLRHLLTKKRYNGFNKLFLFELPFENLDNSCNLVELETLPFLYCGCWSITKKQLKKFPKISRLRCSLRVNKAFMMDIDEDGFETEIKAVDYSFLSHLDSLFYESFGLDNLEVVFPENIKKLTLHECKFPWSKMSTIAKLPHLAVLKLLRRSFDGQTWDFEEEEEVFPNLKLLKLEDLDIVKWTAASSDQFPKLEKLVLRSCYHLQEIPEDCMGNVETLKAIDVIGCSLDMVRQMRKIEETQKEYGTVLQVHEHGNNWDYSSDEESSETGELKS